MTEQLPKRGPGRPRIYKDETDPTEFAPDEEQDARRGKNYEWRERNKEKYREYQRQYQAKYREKNKDRIDEIHRSSSKRKRKVEKQEDQHA